ncbi:cation diffusion facilitator family transporter [Lactiplantibacillus sp. WILCCON 0030]|uniref:Cation diffusion facilitator family transporter n=1 Tax=Lactiplantibacillus brownii TaxID=3069269 RepID=A0ABU1A8Y8_9LACO|nr:cation diffusion facilitator family transporter [Lactiplantibacillus brownii]MDQ7937336.1 cation diffusion facilitator family transporter [Lactiplantibacillus brownii]
MSSNKPQNWQTIQQHVVANLRTARHHLYGNVAVYLSLFLIEHWFAKLGHSQTLRADAFNNLSGILSTGLLMTGLFIATKTHDDDLLGAPISPAEQKSLGPRIQQSRFRFETIYTLLAGVTMIAIAVDIVFKGGLKLIQHSDTPLTSGVAEIGALVSFLLLLILWGFNHFWSRKLKNAALIAASRDTFTDALTSLVTIITIVCTTLLKLYWLDSLISIALGLYILNTGLKIFRESSLNLVDYFDPYLEARYQQQLEHLPGVQQVNFLKAHYDGSLIMLTVTLTVPPTMTALEIYQLTQEINTVMWSQFSVMQTDVMTLPGKLTPKQPNSKQS